MGKADVLLQAGSTITEMSSRRRAKSFNEKSEENIEAPFCSKISGKICKNTPFAIDEDILIFAQDMKNELIRNEAFPS